MRLSIALVPRTRADFARQLAAVAPLAADLVVHGFDTINVPSAPRYGLDAVAACSAAHARGWQGIPHLRSMDIRAEEIDLLIEHLREARVREVLIVAGDPPAQGAPRAPDMTPDRLLAVLAERAPEITRYACFDPNHDADASALARIDEKLAAGANGLFAQPCFTAISIERWHVALASRVPAKRIWWGASPVLGARSLGWWERVNRIAFPDDFAPTLDDWNRRLHVLLRTVREATGNLYVMPIKAPIDATLAPLLPAEALRA